MGRPMPENLRAQLHREHPPEWEIPCPLEYCSARPGKSCRSRTTGRAVGGGSHPSRLDAWLLQQHAA